MEGAEAGGRTDAQGIPQGRKWGLSGSTIKLIAVAAMLIDHTAAAVLARRIIANNRGLAIMDAGSGAFGWMADRALLFAVYRIMRLIGRLGFPIFCFLLAEGFVRTGNVKKYALRLGIFALISEIPFDLALSGRIYNPGYQNVYFTLFAGLCCLWTIRLLSQGMDKLRGKKGTGAKAGTFVPALGIFFLVAGVLSPAGYLFAFVEKPRELNGTEPWKLFAGLCVLSAALLGTYGLEKGLGCLQRVCGNITVLVLFMMLAELLQTDYAGMGVLTIGIIYFLRDRKALSMIGGSTVLTIMNSTEITAFFTAIPVALYNGKRGLRMKYFFYAFYPVHLLLLYLISVWMGLGEIYLL